MSAREELLRLSVAEARRSPVLAALLDQAAHEITRQKDGKFAPWKASASLADVRRWALAYFASAVWVEPLALDEAAALYSLLAMLGEDVSAFWVGHRPEAVKAKVLERVAAENLRRVREGQ